MTKATKMLMFTILYSVEPQYTNIQEVLETLQAYGSAEIVDIEVKVEGAISNVGCGGNCSCADEDNPYTPEDYAWDYSDRDYDQA